MSDTCAECPHPVHLDGACPELIQEWMGHSLVAMPCECAGELSRRAYEYGREVADEPVAAPLVELVARAWLDGHAIAAEEAMLADLRAHLGRAS